MSVSQNFTMLSSQNLYDLAKCRFDEANVLFANNKYDGAVYLCGYAIELILKRRIMLALGWEGYPETSGEFKNYQSFKVHSLDILLHLSGLERKIVDDNIAFARWQIVKRWDSEIRYKKIGSLSKTDAQDIIKATRETINFILPIPT